MRLPYEVDPESFLFAEGYSREAFWKRNAGESGFMKQKQKNGGDHDPFDVKWRKNSAT